MTDVAMVPPILMAGLRSASCKTKRSDRTHTGATLEMEILSQCGENTLGIFKLSCINHGKGSVIGHADPSRIQPIDSIGRVSDRRVRRWLNGNNEMQELS